MKKIIYAIFIGLIVFSSCDKILTISNEAIVEEPVLVNFEIGIGSNSGSMTKAVGFEIFDEFYTHIENGPLIADEYHLILTDTKTGIKYEFNGKWNKNETFIINTGTYHVTGGSKPDSNPYIQDKCSFIFNEDIVVTSSSESVKLTAKYDCFLLIFNGEKFSSIVNYSGVDNTKFYNFKGYKYAFVNYSLYNVDHKDEAYIEGIHGNESIFKFYTGNVVFGKGRYYIYNDKEKTFVFPKMEEGGQEVEDDTTSYEGNDGNVSISENFLESHGDSLYVKMTNPGMLYPLYWKLVTNEETSKEYGEEVWNGVKKIRIDGNIDARDFSTLKWNFRTLTNVDIANTKIVAYSGVYGTVEGYQYDYPANTIPIGAFFYWMSHDIRHFPEELSDEGMSSLKSIKLPNGITKIDRNAFARAYNLVDINIPEGVSIIDMCAFRHCHSLEKVFLPKSVNEIGWYAFTDMNSLKEFYVTSESVPYINDSFGFFYDGTNDEYFEGEGFKRGDMSTVIFLKYNNATLFVPKNSSDLYANWNKYFNKIIEDNG